MKTSIKLALSLLALGCAVATPALRAQETKTPPPRGEGRGPGGPGGGRGMMTPEQQVERLDKAVTLTDDQKTKIAAIYKDTAAKMQAIPQEERREKGMELRKASNAAVRAVLTADQQKKFDDMMAQMRNRGPGGPGGQRGDAPKKEN